MAKPKIRIKGFEGEWIDTTIGTVSNSFDYGINATAMPYDGTNKYLRITDIDESSHLFNQNSLTSPRAGNINLESYILKEGDITFARTGASVGKSFIYDKNDGRVIFAGFLIRAKIKNEVNPHFVFMNSLTKRYEKYIKLVSQRSGQPGMNTKELSDFSFFIPTDNQEQAAIYEYFKSLDLMIFATTKKIASLKQMKSASLISMFPQNGETKPRIRFKGFEREWEDKSFGELYCHNVVKNDLSFGVNKVISVANMYYNPNTYISDSNYLRTYNIFRLGDIAFEGNKSKNFAHGRFVENTIGDGIVSHVFEVFSPINQDYDLNYWKYAINNERIMGKVLMRCTKASTMMTNLVAKDFLKEKILVPSYKEQRKIGSFFANLDKQISLQEQRLEKLKQIKAACLDKMFV